jgi:hypothetical protein
MNDRSEDNPADLGKIMPQSIPAGFEIRAGNQFSLGLIAHKSVPVIMREW